MRDKRKDIAMWKAKEASKNSEKNAAAFGYCLQDKAQGAEKANTCVTGRTVVLYNTDT